MRKARKADRRIHLRLCGILLALLAAILPGAAAEPWKEICTIDGGEGNYRFHARWDPTAQLRLQLRPVTEKGRSLHFFFTAKEAAIKRGAAVKSAKRVAARTFPENLPVLAVPRLELVLKVRRECWWLYARQLPIAQFRYKGPLPVQFGQPLAQFAAGDTRTHFRKVKEFRFESGFTGSKADAHMLLNGWEKAGGDWTVHTAYQDALESEHLERLKTMPMDLQHSPNFYCLMGRKTGKILAGYSFQDNYDVRSSIKVSEVESGLVFYYRDERNCYTFGLVPSKSKPEMCFAKLIRYSSTRMPRKKVLAVVEVPMTTGQWTMPRVRVRDRQIECYIDNIMVMDITEDLPVSGRYGLYVDIPKELKNSKGARFDDFASRSINELQLKNVRDVKMHTIAAKNDFYEEQSAFLRFFRTRGANLPDQPHIVSSLAATERWLAIGSKEHPPHLFGAAFRPKSRHFDVGLLIGFTAAKNPYFRYHCVFDGEFTSLKVEKVENGEPMLVESYREKMPGVGCEKLLRLRAEPGKDHVLRLFLNDRMVLLCQPDGSLHGASGIILGPGAQANVSQFRYEFEPLLKYENQFEKNKTYVTDKFMRHWSSPEGEWFTDPKTKETWHKSDFFGKYSIHMPLIRGSEIHPGVEENQKKAAVFLRVNKDLNLELVAGDKVVAEGELPVEARNQLKSKGAARPAYALHYEDYYLWISSRNRVIAKYRLKHPLKGTRIRIKGFTTDQLAQSFTHRDHVKDFLFKEALHDWRQRGGAWRVINRFSCRPNWSHLNGESSEALAGIWAKYRVRGDFCVEYYVGVRHGKWYEIPNKSFNLTVMNQEDTPSQGYTVTCGAWDPNESERWTRFYRNGKLLQQTNLYTSPRVRENNHRKRYESVTARGRDIHGAWYYIKLRRIGNKLEYFFDNEKVFTIIDDKPFDIGSLGVWSYRNSVMISRVKFAADHIEPRPFEARRVFSMDPPASKRDIEPTGPPMLVNGFDSYLTQSKYWEADINESRGEIRWDWRQDPPYFVFTDRLGGGGPVHAKCKLPLLPLDKIAGVRFKVKRTENAMFDFHYSIGNASGGKLVQEKRYHHYLSGTKISNVECELSGATPVKGVKKSTNWFRSGQWREVTVWFPVRRRSDIGRFVRIDGFGLLRPSYARQGLFGNVPGDSYAVADFRIIYYGVPKIQGIAGASPKMDVQSLRRGGSYTRIKGMNALARQLDRMKRTGLNEVKVTPIGVRDCRSVNLLWISPPEKPEVNVGWHPSEPDAIQIKTKWFDRRLTSAVVLSGGTKVMLEWEGPQKIIGRLPRPLPVTNGTLPIVVKMSGDSQKFSLSLDKQSVRSKPVIRELKPPLFSNFEARPLGTTSIVPPRLSSKERTVLLTQPGFTRSEIKRDSVQGNYLAIQNRNYKGRLLHDISWRESLAQFPLLSLKYRMDDAADVSLSLLQAPVTFSEEQRLVSNITRARYSPPTFGDEKWHSWVGMVSDGKFTATYRKGATTCNRIRFGSMAPRSQTGKFSYLHVDDLVAGPAVRDGNALRFSVTYECPEGVSAVTMALRAGAEPFDMLDQEGRGALKWKEISNGKEVIPDLTGMPDGVCHIFLQATGANGESSEVTGIPFLLDRSAPKLNHLVQGNSDPLTNGSVLLLYAKTNGGAPLDFQGIRFESAGKEQSVSDPFSSIYHRAELDRATITWAHLLRDQLNSAKDGDVIKLKVSNIKDGAGNPVKDVAISFPVRYSTDKRGPSYAGVQYAMPSNIFRGLQEPWLQPNLLKTSFLVSAGGQLKLVRPTSQAPFVRTISGGKQRYFYIRLAKEWPIVKYPSVSFSIRCPGAANKGDISLELRVRGGAKSSIRLPLMNTRAIAGLPPPRVIKPNTWESFTFNIRDILKRWKVPNSARIYQIAFVSSESGKNQILDIRDLAIHAPWRPQNKVIVDAFDVSGIREFEWEYVAAGRTIRKGKQTKNVFLPQQLIGTPVNNGWLYIRAIDHTGKKSYPIRLPASAP